MTGDQTGTVGSPCSSEEAVTCTRMGARTFASDVASRADFDLNRVAAVRRAVDGRVASSAQRPVRCR